MGEIITLPVAWEQKVLRAIEKDTLVQAAYEVAQLANYTLKVQADEQLVADTRRCLLALWARCEREGAT